MHNLHSSNRKKSYEKLIKMEKKLQKIYLTYYNLLIAQEIWQDRYQILSIIFLMEFIEHDDKKCGTCGIKYIVTFS